LFEKLVHQRGLAVVDVRDNRDVTDVLHKLDVVEVAGESDPRRPTAGK
jgi:hypothetical protein